MIIPNNPIQNAAKLYGEQTKVTKTMKTEKTAPSGKKDEVILSSEAQEFQQVLQAVRNQPDVRQDKVKDLAARIDSGNYHVEAKDIAAKLLGQLQANRPR